MTQLTKEQIIKELERKQRSAHSYLEEYDTTYDEVIKRENSEEFEAGYILGVDIAIDMIRRLIVQ